MSMFRTRWLSLLLALGCLFAASAAQAADSVDLAAVLRAAQAAIAAEQEVNGKRLAAFKGRLAEQQRLLAEAQATRGAAERQSNELSRRFDENEVRREELELLLKQHQGNLGELFGVTRQVAGDAASVLQQSLLSAQFGAGADGEDRTTFLRRLATAKALPSIGELERLWFELLREMTETGKVARFEAPVTAAGADAAVAAEVVRVGPFTATAGDRYLGFLPGERALVELSGQPPAAQRERAAALARASGGYQPAVVDPARGALLALYVERPDWLERVDHGGPVGYAILAVGALALLLWLVQLVYLVVVKVAVWRQRGQLDRPGKGNPLGRILLALDPASTAADHPGMAELRVSEAVLREVPRLERFKGLLRLAVAAGPLLGLIGTVVGMIITFQSITAAGASDPKLMANGIGQAMIATVLGLGIAIPLLFANAVLASLSRSITQVLDEHSEALLADRLKEERRAA